MEIKAKAKFIRMSPRKVRLVADLIRGMEVGLAEDQLKFVVKGAREPISKLLNSCVANATNNFKLKKENLFIKTITVDGGSVLKRWQPKAFGRATPIRKRSSHICIILEEKMETTFKEEPRKEEEKEKNLPKPKVVESLKVFTKEKNKDEEKGMDKKVNKDNGQRGKDAGQPKGFLKKIFNRKTG